VVAQAPFTIGTSMMIKAFTKIWLPTIVFLLISGVAQADRFDELELTIRVMDAEHQTASDLINEIELPKDPSQSVGEVQGKDHPGDTDDNKLVGTTGAVADHEDSVGNHDTHRDDFIGDHHESDRNNDREDSGGDRHDD
jgi:hypothetical protein